MLLPVSPKVGWSSGATRGGGLRYVQGAANLEAEFCHRKKIFSLRTAVQSQILTLKKSYFLKSSKSINLFVISAF